MINLNAKCILKIVFVGFLIMGNSWSQWLKNDFPTEDVTAIAAIPGVILAGTRNQGIFSSSDNGANWTARSSGLPGSFYPTILSIAANTKYVFAGTDHRGIFRSTHEDTAWAPANGHIDRYTEIHSIVIRNSEIYATFGSSSQSIFLSIDNGENWSLTTRGLPDHPDVLSLAVNGSDIYAAVSQYGIYQLKDKETSWVAINVGIPEVCCVNSLLASDNTIYAGIQSYGVLVSTNNGASWSVANSGLHNTAITLASFGPVVFASTEKEEKVYVSCNKGKRWAPLDTGSIRRWGISSLTVIGNTLYACTYAGLMQLSLDSIPGALHASNQSRLNYKIPVSGDTLNYGYKLLDAPTDMSVSPGGTIAWTPKNDSSYITQVDYLVIDDNGKWDTSSIIVFVNEAFKASNKQASSKIKVPTEISITQNLGSRNCTINLPGNSFTSDIYIYNLAGRIIDKLSGNQGNSILWQPGSIVQGSYILLVKNDAEQWTKQFVIR